MPKTLSELAIGVLRTADPAEKTRAARDAASAWRGAPDMPVGSSIPPDRPARPARPALRPPREVPRRRITSGVAGRVALLHALAHIEFNAIDLAFDIVVRFADQDLPRAFYDDWVAVGDDEARHYLMLAERLAELGAAYGDMNAHDGLWQAAAETADDLLARLAVVPLVLEARGLDVTPTMIGKLQDAGDDRS
ncbi:MAG: ferritin-like domain-containing protein, partial [Alphaproteobacteria bacterium]|nr:ferritin-like domain-containing protein [Alphaproteobacteria bacterium]